MHKSASTVGALDLGYKSGVSHIKGRKPKVLILYGADEGQIGPDDVSISETIGSDCFNWSITIMKCVM